MSRVRVPQVFLGTCVRIGARMKLCLQSNYSFIACIVFSLLLNLDDNSCNISVTSYPVLGNAIKIYTEVQLEKGRNRDDITVLEMENLIQEHLYK